jgi:glycosyltransferase involved in cell wall biosynthesis
METQKYLNSPKRIEIVPWGVDLEKFNPVHRKDSSKMVKLGFAKKLHELSAPDILLKAFKYASDRCNKRLFLKIAGDGPMAEKLKQDAKEMEIDKNIEWLGWLNNSNELGKFFNSIDIFLMPSRRESFGVSAVEASASGLPVIASNFGGIPEIVQDGKSGFLVNPDNAEGLGKAIIIVAKDKELRARMGYEGRKFVANKYDWNSNVEQMIEIYKQVKSI